MLLDCSVGTVHFVSVTVTVDEDFVMVVAVCFECMGYSVDVYHHSSLLQMGQLGPHPHFSTFGTDGMGVAASWDHDSIFIRGLEVDI